MKELSQREIQLGELQVLKKIAEICVENNWQFFLTYGSMIGAVRHSGIIPWDDDIDIMMPRKDYENIKKYFMENEEKLAPYKLFDQCCVSNYPHMIARVSDQRYHLDFENEKDYGIGLFVDIYPLDGVGNDLKIAVKHIKKTKRLASLCFLTSRKKLGKDNTKSICKMIVKVPAFYWANLLGNKHYSKLLEKESKKYDYDGSDYIANVVWPAGQNDGRNRDIFRKEIFEKKKWITFEDTTMPIIEAYDEFLSAIYGDYMTPPDEKNRTTNHTYNAYRVK